MQGDLKWLKLDMDKSTLTFEYNKGVVEWKVDISNMIGVVGQILVLLEVTDIDQLDAKIKDLVS